MKELLPLQQSHSANQTEFELKNLLILLFKKLIYDNAHDSNVMGIPFEGSNDLVTKQLINANIAKFNTSKIADEDMKYLLLAWKYRNGKRGVEFLETFIKCTWGLGFKIEQLWQCITKEYPLDLKTEDDIKFLKLNINDYFLTSRLRITLIQDEAKEFPTDVARILRNTLPARLFVSEILKEVSVDTNSYIVGDGSAYSISSYYTTKTDSAEKIGDFQIGLTGDGTAYSVVEFIADNL